MADDALRVSDLETYREAEAEITAAIEGEPVAEPLAAALPEDKPFSSLVPAIIGAANMMMTLSATVIANALPTMGRSLHVSPVDLSTTITVYMLALAIFLPVSGWAADRFGAKRVFMAAIVLYAASCAACGFATNLPELLLARFAEGAAGALVGPVGRLVLLRMTPKHDLVRAMSVLTMPALLGPVIGPPIGGLIITFFSWQWIFFMNLPIAVIGVVLVHRYIVDIKEQDAGPLDWIGMILTGIGMGAVVLGFENLGKPNLPAWLVPALLGGGIAFLVAYGVYAKRVSYAILDLKLFKYPTFFASTIGGTFMRMGVGATPFLMAMLLQEAFGLSALEASSMTFASAAAALGMKTCSPPILAKFGFRNTLTVNAVIVGVSFMSYAILSKTTPIALTYGILLTGGFFRSLQFTALNGLSFAEVEQPQMSRASTMSNMGQRLSQSIGVGFASVLLRLFSGPGPAHKLSAWTVEMTFLVMGGVALVSALFFWALPANAGAELQGRPRRVRA